MKQFNYSDIVKDSTDIREALIARWEEIGITHVMVATDANSRGEKGITPNSISKYLKNAYQKGALNQYQILWLCWRWMVPIRLKVGNPYLEKIGNETKVKYKVEFPYNEERALAGLNEMFPITVPLIEKEVPLIEKPKRKKKK